MIVERTPIELLVVDDEPITRLDLSDRLRRRGFKVFRAANAGQAIRIMDTHPAIQAVMTDLQMPGPMNGLELLHEVYRRWPGRGLILVSGWSAPATDEMPPATQYLLKPVNRISLDRALQALDLQ
jgi:DNA-binding NtrC family response regulator